MRKISKLSLLAAASFILAACGANRPDGQTSKWGWAEWPSNTPASSQPSSAPASTSESSWDYIPPSEAPSSEAPSSKPSSKPSSSKSSAPKNDWKDEEAPWTEEFPVGGNDGQGGLAPVTGGGSTELTDAKVAQDVYESVLRDGLELPYEWDEYCELAGVNDAYESYGYWYFYANFGSQTQSDNMMIAAINACSQFLPDYLDLLQSATKNGSVYDEFYATEDMEIVCILEGNFYNGKLYCDFIVGYYDAVLS